MVNGFNRLTNTAPGYVARALALATVSLLALQAGAARAQTAAPATTPAPTPAPAAPWKSPTMNDFINSIKYTGQVEAGISIAPEGPQNALNFGQLFTDHANQFQMNQLLLTAERDIDPAATDYDFGFKLQGLFGTDGRYVHYLGEFTHVTDSHYQPMILEANVTAHLPWGLANGVDLKVGQFPTPEGYEVISASGNPFYSHSYIFNYGLPFVATGALAVVHATSTVDVYLEADSGLNTTVGDGDENDEPAGLAGFNLTMMGGKLTLLALSHFGPEDAKIGIDLKDGLPFGDRANHIFRILNDATLTWKATDKLTLVTDVNYSRENSINAEAYGLAEYAAYPLNDFATLNGRAEVFRDNNNFFVGTFPGGTDFVNAQLGLSNGGVFAAAPTTYSEFTVGVALVPKTPMPVTVTFRPEIRYDRSLNDTTPYGGDKEKKGAVTIAGDVVFGF